MSGSVRDGPGASVRNGGPCVGRAVGGPVTVRAQSRGAKPLRGTAFVTIGTPVASVSIAPASASLGVGDTLRLQATVRDANGIVLTGRNVVWSSTAATVASVNALGLVTGDASGTATISATVDGRSGSATITVETFPSSGLLAFLSFDGNPAHRRGPRRHLQSHPATHGAERVST